MIGEKRIFRSVFSRHKINGTEVEIIKICNDFLDKDNYPIYQVRFPSGQTAIARINELISRETYEDEEKTYREKNGG